MSKRTPSVIVRDILRCIEHVASYTAKLSFDEFSSDFMVVEACLYKKKIDRPAYPERYTELKN
jgi:uncharacterized protein with HEPN domain